LSLMNIFEGYLCEYLLIVIHIYNTVGDLFSNAKN
jgi:hypothetical protein